jgi:hypothetical protein
MLGVCGCGALAEPEGHNQQAAPEPLAKQWVATVLPLLAAGDREHARTVIRRCFEPHFQSLAMQDTLDAFRGNLAGFLRHLEKEWGWVVTYSPEEGIILIDENKSACVCPVLPKQHTGDLGLLCCCSEGFAERMFSLVAGAPVRAEVTASVLRGDRTCRYRITLKRPPALD